MNSIHMESRYNTALFIKNYLLLVISIFVFYAILIRNTRLVSELCLLCKSLEVN